MFPRVAAQSFRGSFSFYETIKHIVIPLSGNRFIFEDSSTTEKCWKCGAQKPLKLFCEQCSSLQEPNKASNYFDLLGIKKDYDIKTNELTKRFKNMQNVLHPDRFSSKEKDELAVSENYSALVNQAYRALLNPLERGLYLLKLEGLSIEEGSVQLDPAFLAEIMERNEELVEANDADSVIRIAKVNQEMLETLTREIHDAFKSGKLQAAKDLLAKMKYYWSLEEKIKEMKQKLGIVA